MCMSLFVFCFFLSNFRFLYILTVQSVLQLSLQAHCKCHSWPCVAINDLMIWFDYGAAEARAIPGICCCGRHGYYQHWGFMYMRMSLWVFCFFLSNFRFLYILTVQTVLQLSLRAHCKCHLWPCVATCNKWFDLSWGRCPCIHSDWWTLCIIIAEDTFKLCNMELFTFFVDVDQNQTLISQRHADGVTFTRDEATGRTRTTSGLCIYTGPGISTAWVESFYPPWGFLRIFPQ